jgi:hypothetical protein
MSERIFPWTKPPSETPIDDAVKAALAGLKGIRAPHRPRLIETPDQLWEQFELYVKHVEENPQYETKPMSVDKKVEMIQVPKRQPYTWQGLASFMGVTYAALHKWRQTREDLAHVMEMIEQVIYNNKYSGGATGFFNSSIITRDLGLADRVETKNEDVTPPAPPIADNTVANRTHPDDPDPFGENRPLYSQAQLDAGMPFHEPKADS